MYESFFGLSQRPFAAAPLVERYFPASSIDGARQALSRCIERAEGCGLCISGPGMGKSLLLAVLGDQFSESFTAVLLSAGSWANRRELLQAICYELKIPYHGLDEGELRLALVNQLTRTDKHRRGIVLLVDEADTLSIPLLEEVRMLSNLVRGGEPCVRLVLAGNLRLEEKFASPQLASFNQRVTCRTYLEPFDRSETSDYVRFQIAVAGGRAEQVFDPAAVDAVYRASDGIPRLVNQMCDHALLLAYNQEQRPVNAVGVEAAWADLQQLPSPWQEPTKTSRIADGAASFIEFGSLDDEEEEDVVELPTHDDSGASTGSVASAAVPREGARVDDSQVQPERDLPGDESEQESASTLNNDRNFPDVLSSEESSREGSQQAFHGAHAQSPHGDDPWFSELHEEYQVWSEADSQGVDAATQAQQHLDDLEQHLVDFENAGADAFGSTEAEIAFEDDDLFDEFEEEERLLDPYAEVAWGGHADRRDAREPISREIDSGESSPFEGECEGHPSDQSGDFAEDEGWEDQGSSAGETAADSTNAGAPVSEVQVNDDQELDWAEAEEWQVNDHYQATDRQHPTEIASPAGLGQARPQPEAIGPAAMPFVTEAENDAVEYLVDPYASLADLDDRIRREAMSAESAGAEPVSGEHDPPREAKEATRELAPAVNLTEEDTRSRGDDGAVPAADTDLPQVEELTAEKLTLAEVIRRRMENDADQGSSPEPAADGDSQPHATMESTDDRLIVIEDDAPLRESATSEEPRVQRQDYRELFAKLRRG